jgi:hypothetical protein
MQHITGTARFQLRISSLEDAINAQNQVRFINAFVGVIDHKTSNYILKKNKIKALILTGIRAFFWKGFWEFARC